MVWEKPPGVNFNPVGELHASSSAGGKYAVFES